MKVTVNNKIQSIEETFSINHMVNLLSIESNGIAIAINQTVIPKSDWSKTPLKENDNITIIKATQGG